MEQRNAAILDAARQGDKQALLRMIPWNWGDFDWSLAKGTVIRRWSQATSDDAKSRLDVTHLARRTRGSLASENNSWSFNGKSTADDLVILLGNDWETVRAST